MIPDKEQDVPPTLLILMRVDVNEQNPIRSQGTDAKGRLRRLEDGKSYYLLAAILDPAQQTTSAPVSYLELEGETRKTYNAIIDRVESLSARYYDPDGYVCQPERFDAPAQKKLSEDLSAVGNQVYQLFDHSGNPVWEWLERLMKPQRAGGQSRDSEDRPLQPVSIITNDFNIPWYWLKRKNVGPFLCEVCSLGLLQLRAIMETDATPQPAANYGRRALLINGSPTLPFTREVLDEVDKCLSVESRRGKFQVERVASTDDMHHQFALYDQGNNEVFREFRIVHFSGHYGETDLMLKDTIISKYLLAPFIQDSVLVLDGCSSAQGLKGWTDVESLTSQLINKGKARGCVVTMLPVKDDPILGKLFWREFYTNLRRGDCPVGYALAKARIALKKFLESIGSDNPMWALYQLIGSPTVPLFEKDDTRHG